MLGAGPAHTRTHIVCMTAYICECVQLHNSRLVGIMMVGHVLYSIVASFVDVKLKYVCAVLLMVSIFELCVRTSRGSNISTNSRQ